MGAVPQLEKRSKTLVVFLTSLHDEFLLLSLLAWWCAWLFLLAEAV
jgi:hypothetical protein